MSILAKARAVTEMPRQVQTSVIISAAAIVIALVAIAIAVGAKNAN